MPESLSDLLHRSVDDVAVPRPDTDLILGQGRRIRARRRAGTTIAAAAAVAAAVVGSTLATGGEPRGAGVTGPSTVPPPVSAADAAAYDAWGSWAVGDQLTIGDHTVTIDGGVTALTQTSAGAVARTDGKDPWVLVRPDGKAQVLGIPASATAVVGDLDAARVAWAEATGEGTRVHVWDVLEDTSLADFLLPLSGVEGVTDLTADVTALGEEWVHLWTDADVGVTVGWPQEHGAIAHDFRITADGDTAALGQRGDRWVLIDPATGEVEHRFDRGLAASLSADGTWLLLYDALRSEGEVRRSVGVPGPALPGVDPSSVWTPAGNLVGRGPGRSVHRCQPSGACDDRAVSAWTPGTELVLPDRS